MSSIADRIAKQYPDADEGRGATVVPLTEVVVGDLRPILLLQPIDENPVGFGRWKIEIIPPVERLVKRKQFIQHQDNGPAIEQQMMKCPDKLELGISKAEDRHAHQWGPRQVESTLPIGFEKSFQ